jgi:hypothetical protein
MFIEIFKMLKSDKWYNTSYEIEILKGQFKKPTEFFETLEKGKRKRKFKITE